MVKRKHAIIWLLLSLITLNISVLFLGKKLNIYNKNAWYTNWYYWVLGIAFLILPAIIMLIIFIVQTTVKICIKFNVGGKEIYGYPYIWIAAFIIPILGWIIFIILLLYTYFMYIIGLFQGKGEY